MEREAQAKTIIAELLQEVDAGVVKLGAGLVLAMRNLVGDGEPLLTPSEMIGQLELEAFYWRSRIPVGIVAKISDFLDRHSDISPKFVV